MRSYFFVIMGGIFAVYGALNYYIGSKGWYILFRFIPYLNSKVYWLIFWFIALAYFFARVGAQYLTEALTDVLTLVGAYWLAAMFYLILILTVIQLIRLVDRPLGFLPQAFWFEQTVGIAVVLLLGAILTYGTWNARHPRITSYNIVIPKHAGTFNKLHVVAVSDIHLGTIIHNGRLMKMVNTINNLHPDIVLLPGDTIDENIGPFIEQNMKETFLKLKPRLGTYAVLGNHEYIGGHTEELIHYLQESGIHVLRDNFQKVNDCFYVVGRDDLSGQRLNHKPRKALADVMKGVDKERPVILLDHQPLHLEDAQRQGVDLQLSGHTHHGQLWPIQYITKRIFEIDWGYLRKGNLQVIVSSGFGTWGPPIRTGNRPEIVNIIIHFAH